MKLKIFNLHINTRSFLTITLLFEESCIYIAFKTTFCRWYKN